MAPLCEGPYLQHAVGCNIRSWACGREVDCVTQCEAQRKVQN